MKFWVNIILIFPILILAGCKSKPSEAQWRGFSECIRREEERVNKIRKDFFKRPLTPYLTSLCKEKFNIPLTREEKKSRRF